MIATDGTATVATYPRGASYLDSRKRAQTKRRKRTAMVRAFNSARTAYPHQSPEFLAAQAARECGASRAAVLDAVAADLIAHAQRPAGGFIDWDDYDHNAWNLH